MTHEMWSAHTKLTSWATRARVNQREKCDVWGVLFTPPIGCSRLLSAVNDLTTTKKNLAKCHFWAALWRSRTTGRPVLFAALSRAQMCLTFVNFYELHQESFHSHQDVLDEEDDGLPGGNRCKSLFSRLTVKTVQFCSCFAEVWTEFHWFIASRCVERDPPILFVSKVLVRRHAIGEIFLRILVHLDAYCSNSINSELRVTKCWIFLEAIVNSFKILFDASLYQIMCNKVFYLFFSLPMTIVMRWLLLNDTVRDWEKIQFPSEDTSAGLILSQEMPTRAVDDALIPVKKAFWALHFRNCLA